MSGRRFSEFVEISSETQAILKSLGFTQATPVQEATIPLFCGNKDVAVDACTGSGKTLSFIIPVVEKLRRLESPLKRFQVGALVIAPTRELSRQIYEVATPFFNSVSWLTSTLLVGGTDPSADVAALKEGGAHVLVGTPGRLEDLIQRCGFLDLKTVEVLVLDEADRLLDMGFQHQLDSIIKRLPKQRRTGLFSATQTEAVAALARAGLRNPVRVNVAVTLKANQNDADGKKSLKKRKQDEENTEQQQAAAGYSQVTPSTLSAHYTICPLRAKVAQLEAFLQAHKDEKIIVYFLTCACVDFFLLTLPLLMGTNSKKGLFALHGRMKQASREATLANFAAQPAGVLLCTDVAARGLDIPDVHWVVQFDAPQDPSSFVHRCGRTARMGRSGNALVYLTQEESTYTDFLKVRKVPLQEAPLIPISEDKVDAAYKMLRKASETDRAVLEAGIKAFISYIRAYKEHHCKFIFRMDDVALGDLATSFALLRLPGMPEVKRAQRQLGVVDKRTLPGFEPSTVDPDSVRFKEKAREKQRQASLKVKVQQKSEKKEQEAREKQHQRQLAAQQQQQSRLPAAKRRQLEGKQELAELNDEYALLKKLKKGKITQKEYDIAAGLTSSDDEEDQVAANGADGTTAANKKKNTEAVLPARDYIGEAMKKKAKKKKKKNRKMAGGVAGTKAD